MTRTDSMKKIFSVLLLGFAMLAPLAVLHAASSGLVVCGNTVAGGVTTDACGWADVVNQISVIINFLIFSIAAPLGAIMFAYAGFLYITNGGNESKIKQAHDVFLYVFIGLVVALAAWLVMNFILDFFLRTGSSFSFLHP